VKQVAQNYKSGELSLLDVPAPACKDGGVLVRSRYSLISTGTEMMKVHEAKMSLLAKARSRPDQVRKVLDTVAQQGLRSAYTKAINRLDSYTPLGYSSCGVVVEVGRGAEEFSPGQVVACAGNEYALHAEVNWVPVNLCVPVPDNLSAQLAAFATVGAIAMHGVRRAEVQLGDTACVIGLGLVGQLAVQLLVASGVAVVGLDTEPERCRLAEAGGAVACDTPDAEGVERIERTLVQLTGGLGADHVFLVAGGSSNGPVETAARLARDRARVVDIGKLKLDLPWNAYYDKELDLRFSRSYGPGRYDEVYEVAGVDYPASYVRWTERRNLGCFIDLLARGALPVESLVAEVFPLKDAVSVYDRLRTGDLRGIGYLFEYSNEETTSAPASTVAVSAPTATGAAPRRAGRVGFKTRLGFIGAGNYASSMLLPYLAARSNVELAHVVTTTSLSAANATRKFGFGSASTDVDHLLGDDTVDAVFVVTRHHTHADLVCRALEAGKATFVEKPLALNDDELHRIVDAIQRTGNDRLMVGFNRRFAPLLTGLRERFGGGDEPAVVRYSVNAGPLAADSWYRNEELEGSRFVGEGGHFIDTISWWLGATPIEVYAAATTDPQENQVALRYDDGSVATIAYVTNGNPRFPKEIFEVSANGRTARLDNFKATTMWTGRSKTTRKSRGSVDKGQTQTLASFVDAVANGGPMPIPLSSLLSTTATTIAVGRSLALGAPQKL
jgi:predicted dehydrogenase/threonine dehydrogenase-like Zn-dependent dehydrogenase